jgi:tetratricopeptide (TPR) repeat protein
MLDPNDINKLNDYSYNKSSKEDRKGLEKQMKENPDFEKEASFFFKLFRGFKALEVEKLNSNIQKWEEKHQQTATSSDTRIISMTFIKYAVAAAVILACLPLGYNYLNSGMTADEIFASNFAHSNAINYTNSRGGGSAEDPMLDENAVAMSEEERAEAEALRLKNALEQATVAAVLNKGINAYNNHNYTDATKYFEAYMTTADAKDKDEVEFYLAVSYLAEGDAAKAKPMFEKMTKVGTKNRKFDAEWYLVLTLLKDNDVELAQKKLDVIIKKPAHTHKEKALKLQEQINTHYTS